MKCALNDCKRNIPLSLQFNCKCGVMYCRTHLHNHNCQFDYKEEHREQLKKDHPRLIVNKLQKI